MTLQQLHYVITISETGSINKAAEILYVSQPSLTGATQELEEELGYIKLKDGAGITATPKDIAENKHNIDFKEVEAAQVPNTRQDVDYTVINSNYAIEAGLNPVKDSLGIEGSASAYGNILVVKEGNEKEPKLLALKAALESQKVVDYINEKYNGSVVSVVEKPTNGFDASIDYNALKGAKITVAASPTPHAEILAIVKDILAEKEITLDIKEYTDYVQPNNVVDSGEIDANYFQHVPYLEDFNAENGTKLVSIATIHVEPLGLYGDIFGIIGMSGAGKSTLVRCINMLERPSGGSVLIDGVDVGALNSKELREIRRNVTMIFQGFNLLMQRTCLKNVCFPMELEGKSKKEAKKHALELLELVGLGEKANAYPAQLSGGQQQRVAIARALATNPKVLLCDEATSALDPKTTHSILSLIKEINEKLGITVIVITHQMSVIEEICNRVAILEKGEVAEQGEVNRIFSSPKSDAAKHLVYPNEEENIAGFGNQRVLRVVFNGSKSTDTPLIAKMAAEEGVVANILYASTKSIGGKAFGTMLLSFPKDSSAADKAVAYLQGYDGITIEEVEPDAK